MPSDVRLSNALERMKIARKFTSSFLEDLTPDEWFWTPSEMTTHVAWHIAHLTCAQYMLVMKRVRGERSDDEKLLPAEFRKQFGRGSTPAVCAENNPPVEEIRSRFDRVHHQALEELADLTDAELDVPSEPAHPMFRTKLDAVSFSSMHEMVHAGQIALLRRLMGKAPLR